MNKILWVGDAPIFPHSGQGRVTREMCKRLHKAGRDVRVAGFSVPTMVGSTSVFADMYYVHHILRHDTSLIAKALSHVQPEVCVLSHDCFEFPGLPSLRKLAPNTKFIGWFTLDVDKLDVRWVPIFESCDVVCSPTKQGVLDVKQQYFDINMKYLRYGIDFAAFSAPKPGEKQLARRAIANIDLDNKFVGIYVGHSYVRKNLLAAIDGWSQWVDQNNIKDAVFLVITHSKKDDVGEWKEVPLDYDLSQWGHPSLIICDSIVDDKTLAALYKASDVFILPTIGEAPCLPILESMASGVVPIVTNFTGLKDFCFDGINSFTMEGITFWPQLWNCRRKLVPPETVRDTIGKAYSIWKNDKPRWHKIQQAAIAKAHEYSWDTSVETLLKIIDGLQGAAIPVTNRVYSV